MMIRYWSVSFSDGSLTRVNETQEPELMTIASAEANMIVWQSTLGVTILPMEKLLEERLVTT